MNTRRSTFLDLLDAICDYADREPEVAMAIVCVLIALLVFGPLVNAFLGPIG